MRNDKYNGEAARVEKLDDGGRNDLYIIYTSGTTGRPKGVIGNCAALLAYLSSQVLQKKPGERVLVCS